MTSKNGIEQPRFWLSDNCFRRIKPADDYKTVPILICGLKIVRFRA